MQMRINKSFGPISSSTLSKFLEFHESIYKIAKIRRFGTDENINIKDHKLFNKDKPSQKRPNDSNHEFLIAIEGKEIGSFNLEQIEQALNKGNISSNSMYSVDGGKSWDRIKRLESFINKTQMEKEQLPSRPKEIIL